ncbi:MAG: DCC1-like thiol-disulfide oxidoreductase family protein [Bacteroidales bacterium]
MKEYIVFFDDICVFCSNSVRFIYRNERKQPFYFASLDSKTFNSISGPLSGNRKPGTDSLVLYKKGRLYLRSGAALRIAWKLRFPIPLASIGLIIPPFIRNGIYDWIARNRYRWFGKREYCFVPDGRLKERFLE